METYSAAPQFGFFPSESWYAIISPTFSDFDFFNDAARSGETYGVGTDHFFFFMEAKSYILISYRFENKLTRGDEFTYNGHFGTIGLKTPLPFGNQEGSFNLSYRYFYKDYRDITPSLFQERRDFRHTVEVKLSQPLYKWLHLNMSYEFIDSVSNLRSIDFTENIASLGISLIF